MVTSTIDGSSGSASWIGVDGSLYFETFESPIFDPIEVPVPDDEYYDDDDEYYDEIDYSDDETATASTPSNPFASYPGKVGPGASDPSEGSELLVDGFGRIKVAIYSQRFIPPRRDDAPKGEVEARMMLSFVPVDGRTPTEFAWINWITSDPYFPQKDVPYQDRDGRAFNDLPFDPRDSSLYNDKIPKYSDGGINFYDRPANPFGYGLEFSTYLLDKVSNTIIYRVDWRLSSDGKWP